MRRSNVMIWLAALVLTSAAAVADAPERVVSLNLCTDQMALLLSAPGQVVSVSRLAHDPRSAAMADAARALPANSGAAEDVVLLQPDLILAGSWTTRATVDLLQRLGHRVEIFAPATSLDDARANLWRMGNLLGQSERTATVIADFDNRRAALQDATGPRPRVALFYALGNTAGTQTLPGDILAAAGLDNIAQARGLPFGGALPLEELIMDAPDMILIGRPYGGHARATELLTHPALTDTGRVFMIDDGPNWSCELPQLLNAVADMRALRLNWQAKQ